MKKIITIISLITLACAYEAPVNAGITDSLKYGYSVAKKKCARALTHIKTNKAYYAAAAASIPMAYYAARYTINYFTTQQNKNLATKESLAERKERIAKQKNQFQQEHSNKFSWRKILKNTQEKKIAALNTATETVANEALRFYDCCQNTAETLKTMGTEIKTIAQQMGADIQAEALQFNDAMTDKVDAIKKTYRIYEAKKEAQKLYDTAVVLNGKSKAEGIELVQKNLESKGVILTSKELTELVSPKKCDILPR